jgi:hypothetical protein
VVAADGQSEDRIPEKPAERAVRNFMELLQGLRVAVTGVQVLFAFLLTVPFSPGFGRIANHDRQLYYVALIGAAVASIFFIAPVAQHRILFRKGMKESLVKRSNLHAMIGMLALMVAMTAATLMVVDYLFKRPVSLITAAVVGLLAGWLWFIQPLIQRSRGSDHS